MRARGVRPCFFTAASEARIIAAAPSLTPEALPAVTVPGRTMRLSAWPVARRGVATRMFILVDSVTGPALPPFNDTGVISSAK
jgi:hypothetical protein